MSKGIFFAFAVICGVSGVMAVDRAEIPVAKIEAATAYCQEHGGLEELSYIRTPLTGPATYITSCRDGQTTKSARNE